jgi:hypothetical protein
MEERDDVSPQPAKLRRQVNITYLIWAYLLNCFEWQVSREGKQLFKEGTLDVAVEDMGVMNINITTISGDLAL